MTIRTTTLSHSTISEAATWTERESRLALTVWAEPNNPALGAWLTRLEETGSETPARDVVTTIITGELAGLSAAEVEAVNQIRPCTLVSDGLERAVRWLTSNSDAVFLIPGDNAWPTALDALGDRRPAGLWVRGDAAALRHARLIAFGGARASTGYGDHVAGELATDLTGWGVAIATGAAYGIDGAATRATLAAGGTPIVVLGGGVDRPYPAGHNDLINRVAIAGGAIVSELAPGAAPTKWRFAARARILGGLSQASVIVEAGWRSGSLLLASETAQLGRRVGAVPGPITSPSSAGTHRLIRESGALLVTDATDALALL